LWFFIADNTDQFMLRRVTVHTDDTVELEAFLFHVLTNTSERVLTESCNINEGAIFHGMTGEIDET
jgi:hypothetical protein